MFSKATPRKEPVLRAAEPALRQDDAALWQGQPPVKDILLTTTPGIEGRPVAAYLGIVTGQAVLSSAILREGPSGLRGLLKRGPSSEDALAGAREAALKEMRSRAVAKSADAVVGVGLDHTVVGNMLMVSASGTAVRLG